MPAPGGFLSFLFFFTVFFFIGTGLCFTIDSKIDLPYPSSALHSDSFPLDSSLSPKIVKAFYEINFVQVHPPQEASKVPLTVTTGFKDCPYTSKDLCKFYFAPTKVSIVQKVDDVIRESKKDPQQLTSDVPVVQGLAVADEEKLLKELSAKINTQMRRPKLTTSTSKKDDVPVFRGTVDVEKVLKSPEVPTLPDYRPRYPEVKRNCFQGNCWNYQY